MIHPSKVERINQGATYISIPESRLERRKYPVIVPEVVLYAVA
jgi:hypothetical protein